MKKPITWYSGLNIYYKLIPFLLLYFAICIVYAQTKLYGDEARYLRFAHNILHGFYSPPYPDIDIWSGPG
ncbi:MAG TPA: hypothetical protein PKJ24_08535, partial [Prolixibacteraceae bacterium]|nr:hypothetical protein [Prolixibacteraceae bacterium]